VWGPTHNPSVSGNAEVLTDLPCQGCGYNLRGARAGGACPECGRRVGESLVPLSEPEKVATGLRYIGNSYLGLLALPLAPISAAFAGSCAGWVGMIVLLSTSLARASGVADLRFRSGAGHLPVIGPRVGMLWVAAVADVVLVAGCLVLLLAGATGGDAGDSAKGLALAALAAWVVAASVVAAIAGWMGASLASMLGVASLARRLRQQWMLMATGPALAVGLFVLCVMLAAIGGAPAGIGLGIIAALALAVLWLVGIVLTMSCMSELAKAVERVRDTRLEKLGTVTGFSREAPSERAEGLGRRKTGDCP
jgi:hypothetical protein